MNALVVVNCIHYHFAKCCNVYHYTINSYHIMMLICRSVHASSDLSLRPTKVNGTKA